MQIVPVERNNTMSNTQKTKIFRIVRGFCPEIHIDEAFQIVDYIIAQSGGKFAKAKQLAENPYRIDGFFSW
jgi:hypothetical protein